MFTTHNEVGKEIVDVLILNVSKQMRNTLAVKAQGENCKGAAYTVYTFSVKEANSVCNTAWSVGAAVFSFGGGEIRNSYNLLVQSAIAVEGLAEQSQFVTLEGGEGMLLT